jgi:hypothetical protein
VVQCGETGTVASSPEGIEMSTECLYKTCRETDGKETSEACVNTGKKYECVTCGEMAEEGLSVSSLFGGSFCSSLVPTLTGTQQYSCALIDDEAMREVIADRYQREIQSTCGFIALDCAKIKKCSDYDDVPVYVGNGNDVKVANLDWMHEQLESVCEKDACKAYRADSGGCVYDGSFPETVDETLGLDWLTDNAIEHLSTVDCENPTTQAAIEEAQREALEEEGFN